MSSDINILGEHGCVYYAVCKRHEIKIYYIQVEMSISNEMSISIQYDKNGYICIRILFENDIRYLFFEMTYILLLWFVLTLVY